MIKINGKSVQKGQINGKEIQKIVINGNVVWAYNPPTPLTYTVRHQEATNTISSYNVGSCSSFIAIDYCTNFVGQSFTRPTTNTITSTNVTLYDISSDQYAKVCFDTNNQTPTLRVAVGNNRANNFACISFNKVINGTVSCCTAVRDQTCEASGDTTINVSLLKGFNFIYVIVDSNTTNKSITISGDSLLTKEFEAVCAIDSYTARGKYACFTRQKSTTSAEYRQITISGTNANDKVCVYAYNVASFAD